MSEHDRFELRIFFRTNPILSWSDARPFFETWFDAAQDLAPITYHARHDTSEPLSSDLLAGLFAKRELPDELRFRNEPRDIGANIIGYDRDPGAKLEMRIPFPLVSGRAELFVDLALRLCRLAAPLYGWGHSKEDVSRAKDPFVTNAWAPKQVYGAYWLTILSAPIVKKLGKAHIAATPAHRVEVLKDGGALIVTSPDPGDVFSPAAREAQARALVHLRPELEYKHALRGLLDRSAALAQPAAAASPPPPIPLEVTEWRPAAEALPVDIDADAAIRGYVNDAEDYISGFHDQITGLMAEDEDSLRRIDEHFLERDYWAAHDVAKLEQLLVPRLGAYLGRMLVNELDGRWAPRRELEESQVLVGDRAWLPFLRVKHFVQSRRAAIEHSLEAFFRAARQHAGA